MQVPTTRRVIVAALSSAVAAWFAEPASAARPPATESDTVEWVESLGGRVERRGGKVTAIVLRGSWVGDGDLARLRGVPALTRLDLSHTRVTDLGLAHLAALASLVELDLAWCELLTDAGVTHLKPLRALRRLVLRGTKVTDTALALLPHWPALTDLDVAFVQLTDAGIPLLGKARGLRALALGGNKLTEQALQVLPLLPRLDRLDLAGVQRTDSGLWSIRFAPGALAPLASLRDLRWLNLAGAPLTAPSLAPLADLPRLETLDLHACARLDDASVTTLARLKGLRFVDLAGTGVTPGGLERLSKAAPRAHVLGGPVTPAKGTPP